MRKVIAFLTALIMVLGCCGLLSGCGGKKTTIYVYNWQEYIGTGEDDTLDVIAAFEEKYPHIRVKYSTYSDNETMYAKLKNGGITVDVIIPSDYMIGRMIQENMLQELDFNNIPNYAGIDESFKGMAHDPENKYSVPYTWGTVGIIYNKKFVAEEDLGSWDLLWNKKYDDKILMFGNSRDAFGIAELLLGYDINSTDEAVLKACAAKLAEQKPLVQQYVMDEVFAAMVEENAYIAPYYAGDYVYMAQENENLGFYLPKEGFNLFVDSMCIPTCAEQKEAAELFINFLSDPEISGKNMDAICYATPITAAKQYMDQELANNPASYPSEEALANGKAFAYLSAETNRRLEELFLEVRNS